MLYDDAALESMDPSVVDPKKVSQPSFFFFFFFPVLSSLIRQKKKGGHDAISCRA
jgi:hypothetical protein